MQFGLSGYNSGFSNIKSVDSIDKNSQKNYFRDNVTSEVKTSKVSARSSKRIEDNKDKFNKAKSNSNLSIKKKIDVQVNGTEVEASYVETDPDCVVKPEPYKK